MGTVKIKSNTPKVLILTDSADTILGMVNASTTDISDRIKRSIMQDLKVDFDDITIVKDYDFDYNNDETKNYKEVISVTVVERELDSVPTSYQYILVDVKSIN